jgi:Zn-dependent peptidase ImmA (M78 family)
LVNSRLEALSRDRARLENPYAHLEQLEEIELGQAAPVVDVKPMATQHKGRARKAVVRSAFVTQEAARIQRALWVELLKKSDGARPKDPVVALDPIAGLNLLGFQVHMVDGLGQFRDGGRTIDVAGLIDPNSMEVKVASHLAGPVQRFTLAHELGHACLHDLQGVAHRDRAMDGSQLDVDVWEIEANRFASHFLMPERLLRERFRTQFLAEHFVPTEETIFALIGAGPEEFSIRFNGLRALSLFLANTRTFNGRNFASLAQQFGVSGLAMAIRLEELSLVRT